MSNNNYEVLRINLNKNRNLINLLPFRKGEIVYGIPTNRGYYPMRLNMLHGLLTTRLGGNRASQRNVMRRAAVKNYLKQKPGDPWHILNIPSNYDNIVLFNNPLTRAPVRIQNIRVFKVNNKRLRSLKKRPRLNIHPPPKNKNYNTLSNVNVSEYLPPKKRFKFPRRSLIKRPVL
jgi:hypothetical protein